MNLDHNNRIVGEASGCHIEFRSQNCSVEIGNGCRLDGLQIVFQSPDCKVIIGDSSIVKGNVYLKSADARLQIGKRLRARTGIFMNITSANVVIGDDCLFASVKFRTSDSHFIYDAESGNLLNHPADITVGDHVWLAEDVLLLAGASVGSGSAVGARSTITGSSKIPEKSLAVGTPAKVVRSGIRWAE